MPASTFPAAKSAILALIAARPAIVSAGIIPTWGGPTENEDIAEEMIHLGPVVGVGEWRTLGAGNRHESYTVALHVIVLKYGDEERAAEERAAALLDEVSAALYADKFLGGLLYSPAALESWEQDNTPMPEQWAARIVAQIRCEAMFTP